MRILHEWQGVRFDILHYSHNIPSLTRILRTFPMRIFARLNGWRRLWVVIALGALLCAIGWAISWGDDAQELYRVKYQVISGFKNPSCSSMIQMLAGGKLSPEPGYDNPCWEL